MRLLNRKLSLTVLFIAALALLVPLLATWFCYGDVTVIPVGEVDVSIYVVALENVEDNGVVNVSRTVEGVVSACRNNFTRFHADEFFMKAWVFGEVEINASCRVLSSWESYREIVESGSNVIIVNAHGETVPVPAGYSKEEWVDRIADAMANRSVIWVHTAGYPFYYYYKEGVGNGTWGEVGFQHLMSHIGLNDVICRPPDYETVKIELSDDVRSNLQYGWDSISEAFFAERGKPLNGSEFENYITFAIWGVPKGYPPGAVVRFSSDGELSFGFYVHVGTYQTFDMDQEPTDADYWRGYAGAAAAIWTCTYRTASKEFIMDAEEAIVKAETEGRTKGLDKARQLLEEARQHYSSCYDVGALRSAYMARAAANNATIPSFLETYLPHLLASIGGITIIGIVIIIEKRNSKGKKNES